MKYLRSTTLGCKDIGIRKSEFVAKTQFPYRLHICDSDWLNFIHFLGYKIRWVSKFRKREDQALILIEFLCCFLPTLRLTKIGLTRIKIDRRPGKRHLQLILSSAAESNYYISIKNTELENIPFKFKISKLSNKCFVSEKLFANMKTSCVKRMQSHTGITPH